jgi:transmembrane sensor
MTALQREALDWVVRLKCGRPVAAVAEAFLQWRQGPGASENEAALRWALRLWSLTGEAAKAAAGEEVSNVIGFPAARSRNVMSRRVFFGAAAASAVLTAGLTSPFGLWPSLGQLRADYHTGKGERRKFAFNEFISIELNTLTRVNVHDEGGERHLQVVSGEIFVEARLPVDRSASIIAADGVINASNAVFNARCIDDRASITCVEGFVRVAYGGREVPLLASQQVSYSASGIGQSLVIDSAVETSWKSGTLIFQNRPLAEVIEEINRYRRGQIVLLNRELGSRIVNGTYNLRELDDIIRQMEQLFGAGITELPGGVVLVT